METLAIIGGGLSGLTCAYTLRHRFDITVFEAADRLGGHVQTVRTPSGSTINPYVFEYTRGLYTRFFELMDEIGFDKFDPYELYMVIHRDGELLHADMPTNLGLLSRNWKTYLDPRNPPSIAHWARYFRFMYRFYRDWKKGRFPDEMQLDQLEAVYPKHADIIRWSLLPFSLVKTLLIPSVNELAKLMFEGITFKALMARELAYLTIRGPGTEYIDLLASKANADIRVSTPVERLERVEGGIDITVGGEVQRFDRAVITTSPLDTPKYLVFRDNAERAFFEGLEQYFDEALVVTHTDPSVMCGVPRKLWGTVGYNYDHAARQNTVTIYQPALVGIREEVFVTYLDPYHLDRSLAPDWPASEWRKMPAGCRIDPQRIIEAKLFKHPLWGFPGQKAAFRKVYEMSGNDRLYFGGVGFDGENAWGQEGAVRAAHAVVDRILKSL